ncbi:alpha/beta-hydrolase [Schizopora paradoxa]|uniref:Alpha/beta-hydrolase n=1 Tax=Schizopora paradoxa TaxID=27342 RepID=A0A0H2S5A7_9AGAM|nr:alpha/beta-hydrolase [Schizopora paradoxa]
MDGLSVLRDSIPNENRFSVFNITSHTYKVVQGHEILLDILVPKRLLDPKFGTENNGQKRPLLIRFHGGWLVGGLRNHELWNSRWLYSLAFHNNAIIISADHRLLPESTIDDLLEDLDDLWSWVISKLSDVLNTSSNTYFENSGFRPSLQVDYEKIMVGGESAGGYCAIQLALRANKLAAKSQGNLPQIRTVVPIYPMLDLKAPYWTEKYPKNIAGNPQYPFSVISNYFEAMEKNKQIVSSTPMGNRGVLAAACVQHGCFLKLFGKDLDILLGQNDIHPEDVIASGAKLPPMLIVHGIQDTVVPVEGTDKFVELVKKYKSISTMDVKCIFSETSLMYARVPGDHEFDFVVGLNDCDWVIKGADFLEKHWIQ